MQVARQLSNLFARPPPPSLKNAATHKKDEKESTGVPQYAPEHKKPLFGESQDLRSQAAEALVFIQEMTPDLSASDLFYIERAVDLLNRLVDEDHIDRVSFQGWTD